MKLWQSSRCASFSPAGLTLWPSWLEPWLVTLSGLSVQVRIPVGLLGHYIGSSYAGLGKAQHIDSSLKTDWLSCFSLAWWEWRVARQRCLVPLRKVGMWQSSRSASFSPADLTLWPSWLERWLATLTGLSVQVRIPVGLPGHYKTMVCAVCLSIFLHTLNHESVGTWMVTFGHPIYAKMTHDLVLNKKEVSWKSSHQILVSGSNTTSGSQAPLTPSNWSTLYRGRVSPVMSWILLKANKGQQASGVGDKRFFSF